MPPQEIIDILSDLGVSTLETAIYWHFWVYRTTGHSVTKLAKQLHTNRVKIYSGLHTLCEKEIMIHNQHGFHALSPRLVIEIHRVKVSRSLQISEAADNTIKDVMQNIQHQVHSSQVFSFSSLPSVCMEIMQRSDVHEIWWFNHNWGDTTSKLYNHLNYTYFEALFLPTRLKKRTQEFTLMRCDDREVQKRQKEFRYGNYLNGQHLSSDFIKADPMALFSDHIMHFDMKKEEVTILYNASTAQTIRTMYESVWQTEVADIPETPTMQHTNVY